MEQVSKSVSNPKSKGICVKIQLADYETILDLQRKIVAAKANNSFKPEVLLLLEHSPVFSLGYRGGRENLLVSEDFLKERDINTFQVERGGNITYHAPGQLTAYPIVNLKKKRLGAASFVEALEEVIIEICGEFGVKAKRKKDARGVWIKNKKLGAVGVAIRRGISFHGLALNVNISLEPFKWMNPCGFRNMEATSLSQELGAQIPMPKIYESATSVFHNVLGIEFDPIDFSELISILPYVPKL